MSGMQELLFGLIFNGVITAVIVTIATVLGRKERTERATREDWKEEMRKAS